jgi:hypothetical protein
VKLNVGAGRDCKEGWVNLDSAPLPGIDIVHDLERCGELGGSICLPKRDGDIFNGIMPCDSVDEFLLSHVLEHIRNVLPMMQELHRIARPGALMTIRCPYGTSNDAFEDPTHVRHIFEGSFMYFAQPTYWRADYLYRGDWQPQEVTLFLSEDGQRLHREQVRRALATQRNIVREIVAKLIAVKPIREPRKELQTAPLLVVRA